MVETSTVLRNGIVHGARVGKLWRFRASDLYLAAKLLRRLAKQKTLNQKAVMAKLKNEITQEDFEMIKGEIANEEARINEEIKALDAERDTMEELIQQGKAEAVDALAHGTGPMSTRGKRY